MSNPGVISLASDSKFGLKIEDNVGEAIHIHYKNIRLDLTTAEFEKLSSAMSGVIDGIVDVEGFSCSEINPKNLVKISPYLMNLTKVTTDEVYPDKLIVNTNGHRYQQLKNIKTKAENKEEASAQEQIVLFGDTNLVLCGHKKCRQIYDSQGNIKVPVTRWFFDKSVTQKKLQNPGKTSLFKKIKRLISKK